MRIADILEKDLVLPEVRGKRKLEVLEELTAHIARYLVGVSEENILAALKERERVGTTAIGDGLAIPHCKLDSVNELKACFGRSSRGIDFGAADGHRTHFIFLLVSPRDSAGKHLKTLAMISRMFTEPEFRAGLLASTTADEMHQLLASREAE